MELIIKITALCLIGALLAVLLKKSNPEFALLLAVAACIAAATMVMSGLERIFAFLNRMLNWAGLSMDLFSPIWKTTAIALITRVGMDLCKDADAKTMASLVEMTGAFGAVLVAIPLFQAVWDMLQSLI